MISKGIGRIVSVALSFGLALLAGAITLILVGGRWAAGEISDGAHGDEVAEFLFNMLGPVAFAFEVAPALTLLPAVVVVAVGEVLRLRSALYYIGASGAAAASMLIVAGPHDGAGPILPHSQYVAILATAGFVAGLVYWAFAGRNA